MARSKLSLPHERRLAKLKAASLTAKVRIAEHRAQLETLTNEIRAMKPPRKQPTEIT